MIKTIAFDMGGVIVTIDNDEPVRRFEEIGIADARHLLDPYVQSGIFGDLEQGRITEEDFRARLSDHAGKPLTWAQCQYAWMGYMKEVPRRCLDALVRLRERGFRLVLASNTNGFIQAWADSADFSPEGLPVSHYLDRLYRSYEVGLMKPSEHFFCHILAEERTLPHEILFVDDSPRNCAAASELGYLTCCPVNGDDWTGRVFELVGM